MEIYMLLLDSRANMMPATVNVHRFLTYMPYLKAGSVYSITGLHVSRCNQSFRHSDSSLLIRFSYATSFDEVTEPASPVSAECFRFRNHNEMLCLANTNTQLPDKKMWRDVMKNSFLQRSNVKGWSFFQRLHRQRS